MRPFHINKLDGEFKIKWFSMTDFHIFLFPLQWNHRFAAAATTQQKKVFITTSYLLYNEKHFLMTFF